MRKILNGAVIALALMGTSFVAIGAADAQGYNRAPPRVVVQRPAPRAALTFNFGNVAFAFSDGYWDSSHRWHTWRNQSEMRRYRASQDNHFNNVRHTRAPNRGWQDNR